MAKESEFCSKMEKKSTGEFGAGKGKDQIYIFKRSFWLLCRNQTVGGKCQDRETSCQLEPATGLVPLTTGLDPLFYILRT